MNQDQIQQPPGGEWDKRHPSYNATLRSLFRRSWLVKIRDVGTLVSEFIATVIICIFMILWNFADNVTPEVIDPPILTSAELFDAAYGVPGLVMAYNRLLAIGKGGNFVAMPDNEYTRSIVVDYYGKSDIPIVYDATPPYKYVNLSNEFAYVNTLQELKDNFNKHSSFSSGFSFNNGGPDPQSWMHNMSINVFENQNILMMYSNNLLACMYHTFGANGQAFIKLNALLGLIYNETNPTTQQELPERVNEPKIPALGFTPPNVLTMRFSHPKVNNEMPLNMAIAFFAAIPIVIAAMPDLTMILTDKESHMLTFILLMGAPESAYWIVAFVSTFLMTLIPYIVMDILFSAWLAMKGTDFVLLLVLSIFFSWAYIMFEAFLSTFFTHSGSGRILTVIFLILIIFFGYLNEAYTMDAPDAVKHVLSIFPFQAYEMVMSVLYEEVRNHRPAIGWDRVSDNSFKYPVWWAFMWLSVDIVLYFLLFLLFNATMDRGFGSPPLTWSDIFHCRFKGAKEIELEDIPNESSIMKVDHLVKRYKGKKVNAVDDVSFDIKRGEIIVMIGPNGAGKSSIINTVSGAISANGGTLTLGGDEPTTQFSGIQGCLGIVFQDNVIINLLSIREHLEIFGRFRGIDEKVLQEAIDFFADNLQLKEMLPNRAGDLSGGQKRKLCIALALLGNPPIIIMDEPTAGVDVQARQLIWKSISNLTSSTCIITTHALEEAEAVSSRMFVISRGKIPFAGTSTELRNQFKCGYVLKIDCEPEAMSQILEAVQKFVPDAKILPERDDVIAMPVSNDIPSVLNELDSRKDELGLEDYSFSVEQLEDVLLRILETN